MANIRIDLEATVINGQTLTFKSPLDCSQITGLIVYYPEGDGVVSKVFQFADAHGNSVGSVSLFADNVLVKVVLDTDLNRAYVQNADTNAYLEGKLKEKYSPDNKPSLNDLGDTPFMIVEAAMDGETEDTSAFAAALNSGVRNIIIPHGKTAVLKRLSLPTGTKILNYGTIKPPAGYGAFSLGVGVENVEIRGGEIVGDATTAGTTAIEGDGCHYCVIDSVKISGFRNKGISLSDGATHNTIKNCVVSGANSSSGGGISIRGADSMYNLIENFHGFNNRIDVVLQSCTRCTVRDLFGHNASSATIMFDGTVTGSKDGAAYNILDGCVSDDAGSGSYAHIYLGNGANHNVVKNFNLKGGSYGIRQNIGAEAYNLFADGVIDGTGSNGIYFGESHNCVIDNVVITNSASKGISMGSSLRNKIQNCRIAGCASDGIQLMTDLTYVTNCLIENNGGGIRVAYGGSYTPKTFVIEDCILVDNATQFITANGVALGDTCKQLTTA